ncbi:hypothetical protein CDCA_CDCA02G0661 [Cyanidium caldarium]|uniref:histidinol-phosphate transaminase n=1 Tax=Cyanidium caldarium TaxID=2771 RepID=A0AAV9IR11_CYACA|nr:hypothetical protein CDCA_CDCA02G0661 [Cyanidium caldarium]
MRALYNFLSASGAWRMDGRRRANRRGRERSPSGRRSCPNGTRGPLWAVNSSDQPIDTDATRVQSMDPSAPSGAFRPGQYIRPELVRMQPYVPILPYEVLARQLGRDPADIVKLDANENPYGPAPGVFQALASAPFLHIYPDPESTELRQALADFTGAPIEHLMVGHGADELIDLVFRLLIEPGKQQRIVNAPPTFGMYPFDADVNGAVVCTVWRREADGYRFPVEEVEALFADGDKVVNGSLSGGPRVIFVASPNNPDGSVLSDADLRRLLALPAVVVLDEAYAEFVDSEDTIDGAMLTDDAPVYSRIQWVQEHRNLIVLRTFSKWAGLAGLRVGYGAFPLELIEQLWKIKQPYNVNAAGQIAAKVSLSERADLFHKVARLKAERARFFQVMAERHASWMRLYPSQSNFVLCRVLRHPRPESSLGTDAGSSAPARALRDFLRDRGILIRYYSSPGLEDCIRVSMGTPAQMDRLYTALDEFLDGGD